MKKFISTMVIFTIIVINISPTSAEVTFLDVDTKHPNYSSIMQLVKDGAIKGFPDGTFQPNQLVTRAEFIKIFLRDTLTIKDREKSCFKDVKEEWFSRDICKAKKLSIVKGFSDGSFHPEQNIILAELLKIAIDGERVARKGNIPTKSYKTAPTEWYTPYFDTAIENNLKPDTLTNPRHLVTRAEAAEIINRIKTFSKINQQPKSPERFNYTLNEPIAPTITPKIDVKKFIPPTDTSAIKSKILIADTEDSLVSRYVFETDKEPIEIKKLHIQNAITGTNNAIKKASLLYNQKTKKSYFNTNDELSFSSINYLIPQNESGVINVLIDLNPLQVTNLPTGTKIQLNLDLSPTNNFNAIGQFSNNTYDGSTLNARPGKEMTIRKSVPTFYNKTDELQLHFGNDQVVYRLEARANPKGDVAIKKLTFSLTSSGINTGENSIGKINGWRLMANGEEIDNTTLVNNKLTFELTTERRIPKSNFTIFDIIGQVQPESGTSNPRITTQLLQDTNEAADSVNGDNSGTLTEVNNAFNNIVWSDLSDNVGEREDWTNGYLLPGMENLQSFTIQ
jgi:hypothetical protein